MEIVDAHHHLWDLRRNRYPWLVDGPMIPFRYGDYGKIRRDYLPTDYRRDSARQNVVATVHMEAEIDPAHEVDETRWIHEVAETSRRERTLLRDYVIEKLITRRASV